jgi:hypothetical protein
MKMQNPRFRIPVPAPTLTPLDLLKAAAKKALGALPSPPAPPAGGAQGTNDPEAGDGNGNGNG